MENASERYFYGDVLRRKHAMVEYRILLWLFYDLQPAKKIHFEDISFSATKRKIIICS